MRQTTIALLAAATAALAAAPSFAGAADPAPITLAEVEAAQKAWGEGIVRIGQVHQAGGDVRAAALAHLETLYAFDQGKVLFKPTLASADPFRNTLPEALTYFVGAPGTEDAGFAITPWTAVRFKNEDLLVDRDDALAMGTYWFRRVDGTEVRVEYTKGYVRGADGRLKIRLQHSSLPAPAAP